MHTRQLLALVGAAGALLSSVGALAQQNAPAATSVASGTAVKDIAGGEVGIVESVDGDF